MYAATCANHDCTEYGIAKSSEAPLRPEEQVICGECGNDCEVTSEADLEREPS